MESDDGLQQFLAVAADHRLLTHAEERELGRRMKAGDERAREEMARHNIRLVVAIARKYRDKGMPMEDIIQEGMVGLDRATRKFDVDLGYKFSTYATWWIRQAIQRGLIANSSTIRVPSQVTSARAKIRREMADNPEADIETVAAKHGLSALQAHRAIHAAEVVTSLDREVSMSSERSQTLLESLADPAADDPADLVSGSGALLDAMKELDETQRRVLELRFGFDDGRARSLAEISEALDIPQAVVRVAQRTGMDRLREMLV